MRVLIVGGGLCGMASAVALADAGHEVLLLERRSGQHESGSGITLTSPAIRALVRLGVYEECLARGRGLTHIREYDASGEELRTIPLPSSIGEGGPGMLGMLRRELHAVLRERAMRAGARVREGVRIASIAQHHGGATATAADGETFEAELLIGADGLRSTVRDAAFGRLEPEFQHQGCYRAVVPRPADADQEADFSGVVGVHPGFTPLGGDAMYIYCTVAAPDASIPTREEQPARMRELLAPFGGIMGRLRPSIVEPEQLDYRPFETLLAPAPWARGRVVLVGDAAHCTTPHLAAGAAMGLEDALVLAEELAERPLERALERYTERRYERARFVVETSVTLARWQLEPVRADRDASGLKIAARRLLAEAY